MSSISNDIGFLSTGTWQDTHTHTHTHTDTHTHRTFMSTLHDLSICSKANLKELRPGFLEKNTFCTSRLYQFRSKKDHQYALKELSSLNCNNIL